MASGQRPAGLALASADAPTGNNNQLAGTPTTAGAFTMKLTDGQAIRLERTAGERAFSRQNYSAGSWQSSACGSISIRSAQLLRPADTQPCLSWWPEKPMSSTGSKRCDSGGWTWHDRC